MDFDTAEKLDEHVDEHWPHDKEARKTLRRLREVVHQAETINFYVEPLQDIDRVLDIFIRTNSGGVPLGYSDLLMSYTTLFIEARRLHLAKRLREVAGAIPSAP